MTSCTEGSLIRLAACIIDGIALRRSASSTASPTEGLPTRATESPCLEHPILSELDLTSPTAETPTPVELTPKFFSLLQITWALDLSSARLALQPASIRIPVGLYSTAIETVSADTEALIHVSSRITVRAEYFPTTLPGTLTESCSFGPTPPLESHATAST